MIPLVSRRAGAMPGMISRGRSPHRGEIQRQHTESKGKVALRSWAFFGPEVEKRGQAIRNQLLVKGRRHRPLGSEPHHCCCISSCIISCSPYSPPPPNSSSTKASPSSAAPMNSSKNPSPSSATCANSSTFSNNSPRKPPS